MLGHEYPSEHTSAASEKRKATFDTMYAAAHPVSKRNMLYILDRGIPNLSAVWVPGAPQPAKGGADEFLSVQVGGITAGARKIYVTLEACKRIASNGLLCAMPGVGAIIWMNLTLEKVKERGVAMHKGAAYYLRHTGEKPLKVKMTSKLF